MSEKGKKTAGDAAWFLSKMALVIAFEVFMVAFALTFGGFLFMLFKSAGHPWLALLMGAGGIATGLAARVVGRAWLLLNFVKDDEPDGSGG